MTTTTTTPTTPETPTPKRARRARPAPHAVPVLVDYHLRHREECIRTFMSALHGDTGPLYIGRAEYAGTPAIVIALAGPAGPTDSVPIAIVVDPDAVRILAQSEPTTPATPKAPLSTGLYL